jgi:rhamnopyranosyl-N-acetylglucosaminyl-diphospho-decaprenol beta-1,3/1,4-galactofuranosyltransferase
MLINKVVAVMVTFNRLSLLKVAIDALRKQTATVSRIIVVNNGSTDGTGDWLDSQPDLIVKHQVNSGGAGGFSSGISYAAEYNSDWIWLMDDDTICMPQALEKLLYGAQQLDAVKVGFVCSKCVWTDGRPHYMNLVDIKPFFNNDLPFNLYDEHQLLLTEGCSFVSVLVNTKAVLELGLPYKEFYIWGDDQEYTHRITKAGYLGLYCADSIAVHETPSNYRAYVYNDDIKNLWKHKCGFRNELFMIRKNKGVLHYLFYMIARLIYTGFKILKLRKDHKWEFFKGMYAAVWSSLFFHPKIKMVNSR